MARMALIREHDPFSGDVVDEPDVPEVPGVVTVPAEVATQSKPKQVRKGRRPRRVPTAAEMDAARAKVTRR